MNGHTRWVFVLGLMAIQLVGSVGAAQDEPAGANEPDVVDESANTPPTSAHTTETDANQMGAADATTTSMRNEAPSDGTGTESADPAGGRLRLSFSSIRAWAGSELQMASADAPNAYATVCTLPCRTELEPGEYRFSVLRTNGSAVPVSAALRFDADSNISFKYGMSTPAWASAIVGLTGILGVLITGGLTIAGAAQDDRNLTIGGAVGLALSSGLFVGGLIVFVRSERGLRATVRAIE